MTRACPCRPRGTQLPPLPRGGSRGGGRFLDESVCHCSASGLAILAFLWIIATFPASTLAQPSRGVPLTEDEFRQIGEQGLGLRGNSRVWSTEYFNNELIFGTNHNFLCIVRAGVVAGQNQSPELPVECADNLFDNDFRGRIYAWDSVSGEVHLRYVSPTVSALLSDGTRVDIARDAGYRTIASFTESDGTKALYVGTFTSTDLPQPPARLLRSTDGRNFTEVPVQGEFASRVRSYRSLTVFNNRLYVIALISGDEGSVVLEASDPASGAFQVITTGLLPPGDAIFEMTSFKGFLYLGTFSPDGFELHKTAASGPLPYHFERVLREGAYRGPGSQSVLSLKSFGDYLYLGTGFYFGSLSINPDFKPAASELLRVSADDSWQIVAGEERQTPDGFKKPISGYGAGFGNLFTGYIWKMAEYNGVLYVGTLDTSSVIQYGTEPSLENAIASEESRNYQALLRLAQEVGAGEIADVISAVEGGFDLWATPDGVHLTLVSRTGFGDPNDWGVRSFESTSLGLFLGTDNPYFGARLYLGQRQGTDTDGDSHPDADDNCPGLWNLNPFDTDGDGVGDVCDEDIDGDCVVNALDATIYVADGDPTDTDEDGVPDGCDDDDDGDTVPDWQDNCPLVVNYDQEMVCAPVAEVPDPTANQENPLSPAVPSACGAIGTLLLWPLVFGLRFRGWRRERTVRSVISVQSEIG